LLERGIVFQDQDLISLFDSLRFPTNSTPFLNRVEIFANGHLFQVLPPRDSKEEHLSHLREKIALGLGFGVIDSDLVYFRKFADRLLKMTEYASERNCILYVDAEQTFIQDQIASVA
jgi:hypothetical protein